VNGLARAEEDKKQLNSLQCVSVIMSSLNDIEKIARRYNELGLGAGRIGFGRRPAVLVVDA